MAEIPTEREPQRRSIQAFSPQDLQSTGFRLIDDSINDRTVIKAMQGPDMIVEAWHARLKA